MYRPVPFTLQGQNPFQAVLQSHGGLQVVAIEYRNTYSMADERLPPDILRKSKSVVPFTSPKFCRSVSRKHFIPASYRNFHVLPSPGPASPFCHRLCRNVFLAHIYVVILPHVAKM